MQRHAHTGLILAAFLLALAPSAINATPVSICNTPMYDGVCCDSTASPTLWPSGNGCCMGGQPYPGPTCPLLIITPAPQGDNTLIADSENYRVIEVDANKNIVWKYPDGPKSGSTLRPKYATRLENGNTLIANGNAVLEVTPDKQVVWEYPAANLPYGNRYVSAERLPNGNTLISDADYYLNNPPAGYGTYNGRVIEVNPAKNIVWEYTTEIDHDYILPGFENQNYAGKYYKQPLYPRAAFRLPNDNTLITDAGSDRVLEVNPAKQVVWSYGPRTVPVHDYLRPTAPYVAFAFRLANGNTLITDTVNSNVSEITPAGITVNQYKNANPPDTSQAWFPSSATRLSNGNLLIADSQNQRVIEVNPAGQIVWQYGTTGVGTESGSFNPLTAFRVRPVPSVSPTPTPSPSPTPNPSPTPSISPSPSASPSASPSPSPSVSPTATINPSPFMPSATPTLPPNVRPDASITLTCPSNLVTGSKIVLATFTQSFGQANCTPQVELGVKTSRGQDVPVAFSGCSNGRSAFNVTTQADGTYTALANYSDSVHTCVFAVAGTPPQPTPELAPGLVLLAALLAASFAYARPKRRK